LLTRVVLSIAALATEPQPLSPPATTLGPAPAEATLPRPPAIRRMTLGEALDYARKNQPSLLSARALLAGRQAEARVPAALFLPRVTISAQVLEGTANNSSASYLNVYGIDLPRIGGVPVGSKSWSPDASSLAAAGLRQEMFDFGRIAALQAVANAAVDAERSVNEVTRLDVDFAVETGFYAVRTAKGILGAAQAAYDRSLLNYNTAVAGVKAGLREPIELTRAESDLDRFDVGRVRAQAGLDAAQSVFAAVVGVPDLVLDAQGEPPPVLPAPTLAQAVAQAFQNDPLLRARQALIRQQASTTQAIAAELHPDLSLTASLNGRAGGAQPSGASVPEGQGFVPNIPNWDAAVVLTWPLLDFGVLAREDASRALEGARQAELAEARQQLAANVQKAYVDLVAASRALPSLEKTLVAAHANYDQAEARFKNQLGSSVELADAQALLTTAEVDVTIGRFAVLQARAALGRVIAEGMNRE